MTTKREWMLGSEARMRTNWAGNYTYQSKHQSAPSSVESIRGFLLEGQRVHALGTRHAFNGVADAEHGRQIATTAFDGRELDAAAAQVTVGSGVTYAQLGAWLEARGWALENLASLPHISVVGATQTGTHGSGTNHGNLATAVEAMELLTADGSLRRLSRGEEGERFDGMVVACGALGIVTSMTLNLVPSFAVRQTVYERLPMEALRGSLEEVFASGYSVSLFTNWQNRTIDQIWVKERVEPNTPAPRADILGAAPATRECHPLPEHDARNCTQQGSKPGAWHERLPHFRSEFTPSSGDEIQTEYFVPLQQGYAAIQAVAAIAEQFAPLLFVAELRTIAADALWLSPCYERTSLAFHFTWKRDWPAVQQVLPLLESALAPFDARPHWAKAFTIDPSRVHALYPRMREFVDLVEALDPSGRFRNDFLDRYIFRA